MRTIFKILVAGVIAVTTVGSVLSAPPASAAQAVSKCSASVVFIGVRGTLAPAGSGSTESGRLYSTGGFGAQVQPIRDRFVASGSGVSTWARALRYPAGTTSYYPSLYAGRDALVAFLNTLTGCRTIPKIVLAGHSQGADVVMSAMSSTALKTSVRARIKAAIVLGDPQWRPRMNYNVSGSPTSGGGIMGGGRGTYFTDRLESWYWTKARVLGGSQLAWQSRIQSWCFAQDWACQGLLKTAYRDKVHNAYRDSASAYYTWARHMVTST